MNRIEQAFQHKAIIPFLTCGDPDLETTGKLVRELVNAGADLIELGIPFSDPTAEGPVIMDADERALKNGVTTDQIFDLVIDLRKDVKIPLVFMTYANVIFSYGIERFMKRCEETGIDGIILPDVPYEEKDEFEGEAEKHGIAFIRMIAPTSEARIAKIADGAKGFIYVVSSMGVTGTRKEITTDIAALTSVVRSVTDTPCAVGFGISDPDQARRMAEMSDGAIVGSAIVKLIAKYGRDCVPHVKAFAASLAESVHGISGN